MSAQPALSDLDSDVNPSSVSEQVGMVFRLRGFQAGSRRKVVLVEHHAHTPVAHKLTGGGRP
ncbi:hypothetical protein BJD99_14430 [Rhodococcus sp. 1163]|nr:hypothetical protein BJD99_14430 [Rhodococcus sp. 1163]